MESGQESRDKEEREFVEGKISVNELRIKNHLDPLDDELADNRFSLDSIGRPDKQ